MARNVQNSASPPVGRERLCPRIAVDADGREGGAR
jgi:hypothetical protein